MIPSRSVATMASEAEVRIASATRRVRLIHASIVLSFEPALELRQAAENAAVKRLPQERRQRRPAAVIQAHEARRLELPDRRHAVVFRSDARVNVGQQRQAADEQEQTVQKAQG